MSQAKDSLSPTEPSGKVTNQFPNWLLFLVSMLAISFSPFGIFGLWVLGFPPVVNDNLLFWSLEAILFVVGFIPFATLADRKEYKYVTLIGIFAVIDIGLYWFASNFAAIAGSFST